VDDPVVPQRWKSRLAARHGPDPGGAVHRGGNHSLPVSAELRPDHFGLVSERIPTGCPLDASQRRAVPSAEAVITSRLSGLAFAAITE